MRCVRLSPGAAGATPISLCTDDAAYFDMGADDVSIVVGSSFWQHNASMVEVDGLSQTITIQYAPFDDTFVTWWWVGAGVGMGAQVVYIAFVLGRRRLTVRAFLLHQAKHPGKGASEAWPVAWPLTVGGFVLVPMAAAAITIAWVGGLYVQNNVDTPVRCPMLFPLIIDY